MRRVEHIMGMPISVDIPHAKTSKVFKTVFDKFKQIDDKFSPYKKNSELSRYQRREIGKDSLSLEFKKIIEACEEAEEQTGGYFSAHYSGKYDPTGYVKGWAISEVSKIIEKEGYKVFCIGAGGDILARSDGDKIWKIGIQDPRNPKKILNMLSISNGAVATSGNYERGEHIINPKTGKPAKKILSVTITGPDIIWVDVLATAVFAEDLVESTRLAEEEGYAAMIIDKNNSLCIIGDMRNAMNSS